MPVARRPVLTPMPPIRKRARHTSLATHRLGDAPLGRRTAWATHRLGDAPLGRRTAWATHRLGDAPLGRRTAWATHRLGDAPLGRRTAWATHRLGDAPLGRRTAWATHRLGDAPLGRRTAWATHRLIPLYGPDTDGQEAFPHPSGHGPARLGHGFRLRDLTPVLKRLANALRNAVLRGLRAKTPDSALEGAPPPSPCVRRRFSGGRR